ncbi:MAG: alpha-amylase/4-alpha-glucanotransferase domain-containing protein [Verrucomicrobiota bacterium]
MNHLNLILSLHHHQPIGNFPEVLELCYTRCYEPLLKAIEAHPKINITLSYSGPILQFLLEKHPEYLERLKCLIERDQIEILSDGFYEPVLAELPEEDRIGQLRKMNQWQAEHLGYAPHGVWTAEGVWSPSLAQTYFENGLRYTILRAGRFVYAGEKENELNGAFVTEHLGHPIYLFPNDTNILKRMPFGKVDDLLIYLRRVANRRNEQTFTAADIAERWGVWPGTFDSVHQSGYLSELFTTLSDASGWLKLIRFKDYLLSHKPTRLIYIPAGSRWEMGAWSLPDGSRTDYRRARRNLAIRHDSHLFLPFFRSGSFASFKARYHEANQMHKKGLWLKKLLKDSSPSQIDECQDLLWQAQCNTAYWFGTSGGLYQPHLRQAIWKRLLHAESILAANRNGWNISSHDINADGQEEVLVTHPKIFCGIHPAYGGSCFEYSLLPKHLNLASHLTRHSESLSGLTDDSLIPPSDLQEQEDQSKSDWYKRHLFQDHLFNRHTHSEDLFENKAVELGDFIDQPYEIVDSQNLSNRALITLERKGGLYRNQMHQKVTLRKTYHWGAETYQLKVVYQIINTSDLPLEAILATEVNLHLPFSKQSNDRIILEDRETSPTEISFDGYGKKIVYHSQTAGLEVQLLSEQEANLWCYPLMSSETNDKISHEVLQGNALLIGWPFDIPPKDAKTFSIKLQCAEL